MLLLIQYTLIFSSVLTLVALGGCISEHSGVINLGLEGIMVIGALGGALMMRYCQTESAFVMVILVILAAALFGVIYSSLLAVACINFKADQTLVGFGRFRKDFAVVPDVFGGRDGELFVCQLRLCLFIGKRFAANGAHPVRVCAAEVAVVQHLFHKDRCVFVFGHIHMDLHFHIAVAQKCDENAGIQT